MRTAIAILLLVVGLGITLYGLGNALMSIGGIYANALDSPMSDPAVDEKSAGKSAWNFALIGMLGVPPTIVGSTMLTTGMIRRLRALAQPTRPAQRRHPPLR